MDGLEAFSLESGASPDSHSADSPARGGPHTSLRRNHPYQGWGGCPAPSLSWLSSRRSAGKSPSSFPGTAFPGTALPGDRTESSESSEAAEVDRIVLHVRSGPTCALNQLPVAVDELEERLAEIFSGRTRKVVFLRGHEGARYGQLLETADRSRGGGGEVLELVIGSGGPVLTD